MADHFEHGPEAPITLSLIGIACLAGLFNATVEPEDVLQYFSEDTESSVTISESPAGSENLLPYVIE